MSAPALFLALAATGAPLQEAAPTRRDSAQVLAAFEGFARAAGPCVATVRDGDRAIALATVVSADGLLLTKASELSADADLRCTLYDDRTLPATVVARDPNFDVALLSVDAQALVPADWSTTPVAAGQLVVSAGQRGVPLGIGIVGVAPKHIGGARGRLGVVLEVGVEAAVVGRVTADSPAAIAGIQAGDHIVAVGGEGVATRAEATARIRAGSAGEVLQLTLERAGRRVEIAPILAVRSEQGNDNALEGEQSALRAGFPSALQHDAVIGPEDVGGPLVDLSGRTVGLNIARAGRVSTYAIPAADAADLVARLRGNSAHRPASPTPGWTRFRGPNGTGVSAASDLPVEFGPEVNLRWRAAAPAASSSPVLTADAVYLTASTEALLLVICLDRATGEERWRRPLMRARDMELYEANDSASPSPATDGTNVYAFFPELGLISFDATGEERWRLPLGPFLSFYGMSASPILAGDTLLLLCDQQRDSFLIAVDAATGEERWKTERSGTLEGFATPVLYPSAEQPEQVVCFGMYFVCGYSLATGAELWRCGGVGYTAICSPLIHGDRLYVCTETRGGQPFPGFDTYVGMDADGDEQLSRREVEGHWVGDSFGWVDMDRDGHITRTEWEFIQAGENNRDNGLVAFDLSTLGGDEPMRELWRLGRATPAIATPVVLDGVLYAVKDGGICTSLDAQTGEVLGRRRLEGAQGDYWSSPIAADGKVLLASTSGQVTVISAGGADWEVLAVNDLGEEVRATPAIAGDAIFVRTEEAVWCFGRALAD